MAKGIHLVIPMAGDGQRFRNEGITVPKPLIEVAGVPLYQLVLANLWDPRIERVTIISRREFRLEEKAAFLEERLAASLTIISVDRTTGGPADSVELAYRGLRSGDSVVVANSDQWIDFPIANFYLDLLENAISGNIMTMRDCDPKWSYVELDASNHVERVVEKEVVSEFATVGIYGFKSGQKMLSAFSAMRKRNELVNNEYYVAPAYNHLDRSEGPVTVVDVGRVGEKMHGLGTPLDLQQFISSQKMPRAIRAAHERFKLT